MKRRTIIAIAIAGILIVAGLALCVVSVDMGARPKQLFTDGSFTLELDNGLELGISDKNIGISGTRNPGSNISTWPGEGGEVAIENINEIVINWVDGEVRIEPAKGNAVSFFETAGGAAVEGERALDYRVDGGRLYIDYSEGDSFWGISFGSFESKDLVVYVTESVRSISVDTVSGDVHVSGLDLAGELSVSTTSGGITTGDCALGAFSGESVSGLIMFGGSCGEFEADSTSGQVAAVFSSAPGDVDVETVSGRVDLAFPKGTQFELEFETVSGELKSELAFVMEDGKYKHGRGLEVDVSTVSGNCTVNEY